MLLPVNKTAAEVTCSVDSGHGSGGSKWIPPYGYNSYKGCYASGFPLEGSGTAAVQVPTSLHVMSVSVLPTGTSGDYGCTPNGDYGIKVKITYQVLDQNTRAIQSSLMEPQEEVTGFYINGVPQPNPTPNWADIGPTRISGSVSVHQP